MSGWTDFLPERALVMLPGQVVAEVQRPLLWVNIDPQTPSAGRDLLVKMLAAIQMELGDFELKRASGDEMILELKGRRWTLPSPDRLLQEPSLKRPAWQGLKEFSTFFAT